MLHVDVEALALPNEILGQVGAEFRRVNAPVDSPDRFGSSETIQYVRSPELSRVPNFVAFGEVIEDSVVRKAVCVGEQPDSQSSAYADAASVGVYFFDDDSRRLGLWRFRFNTSLTFARLENSLQSEGALRV